MTEVDLSNLRRDIDAIDDQIHDLLMKRTALVDGVRRSKADSGSINYRPAREAQILLRLIARHQGPFPKPVVARIWREIITAMLRLQGPFSVAVYAPEETSATRDLARDHFGFVTPISVHRSARSVINAVGEREASIGVLPVPQDNEPTPWWPALLAYPDGGPTIVARLPFASANTGRGERPEALVIGAQDHEASGFDRGFLLVRASAQVSRASLNEALGGVGLESIYTITRPDDNDPSQTLFLVEIDGFVAANDARLASLIESEGSPVGNIDVLGGYATPFNIADLAEEAG